LKDILLAIRVFILSFLLVAAFGSSVIAQKRSKKPKNSQEKTERIAELYFTEGEKYFVLEDYAKAYMLFNKVLESDPQNATVHYKIAEVVAKGDDTEKAIYHANKALELESNNKYFYLLAIELYNKRTDFQKSAKLYEEMIEKIPGTQKYYYDLAALYIFSEEYDKALEAYEMLEVEYGLSPQIAYQRQKIYLKKNDLKQAIAESEKLIEAFPNESTYKVDLAQILYSNNRASEAIKVLQETITADPNFSQARIQLATIYLDKREYELADEQFLIVFADGSLNIDPKIQVLTEYIQKFPDSRATEVAFKLGEKLKEAHPDNAKTYMILGDMHLRMENMDSALSNYEQSIEMDRQNFAVWNNLLDLLLRRNEFDKVIEYSEKALITFPNQASVYYFNGFANFRTKNYEEAIWAFEQGRKLARTEPKLLLYFNSLLGDGYHAIGNHRKSDEAYDRVLKIDPNNYIVLNNYSYYLSLRREKLDKALKMCERLIAANPDNSTYLDTYAWVLFQAGQYKEARKTMERALGGENVRGVYYEHYGDILYKLGDIDGAVVNWQKAKGMDSSLENIDKKIADRKLYE